jgi:ABC-type microcin C transport system duplicated ATPase subunit YejF
MLFEASSHQVSLPPPPLEAAPLLQVCDVTRAYQLPRRGIFSAPQLFRAVDKVNFTLRAGERLGLVGESGCGKSTLTRAILGLEPVQAGTITLNGAPVWAGSRPNREVRRNIQVVFQDPYGSFNPRHKVARLITEPYHLPCAIMTLCCISSSGCATRRIGLPLVLIGPNAPKPSPPPRLTRCRASAPDAKKPCYHILVLPKQ